MSFDGQHIARTSRVTMRIERAELFEADALARRSYRQGLRCG